MALSFEDSLKAAKAESEAAAVFAAMPAVADNASVMTLDYGIAAAADDGIVAYAGTEYDKKYDSYSMLVDNKVSAIDENKNIKFADGQINLTQESNSQYIPFKMPRYYDGFDLSTATLSVYWVNELGSGSAAAPVNVSYDSEYIYFAWLVDGGVTRYAGNVKFEIQARGNIVSDSGISSSYVWKSRSGEIGIIQALEYNEVIEPDEGWQTDFFSEANRILNEANTAATNAINAVDRAEAAASVLESVVDDAVDTLRGEVDEIVADKLTSEMSEYAKNADVENTLTGYAKTTDLPVNVSELENDSNYATKSEVESIIADADLDKYATVEYVGDIPSDLADKEGNAVEVDSVIEYVDYKVDMVDVAEQLESYATKDYVAGAIADQDITSKLGNYYTKEETYNKTEIDNVVSNVTVDLTGYATEIYVNEKTETIVSDVDTNKKSITSLNSAVATINQELAGIDKSPRVTYKATYGDVELDDGSTAEYMFTLWKTENGVEEVQDRFQIAGGGGGSGAGSIKEFGIKYIDGYGTPFVATVNDSIVIKYEFVGTDSVGDTNLDGIASWKVGNRVVATEDVSTGECEFDLTEYVTVGDNKILLTITHTTGAVATKAWTVKVIDVRLESSFDDSRVNAANQPVNFSFTPYGGVNKVVHFLLDGEEIETKVSQASAAGLSDSYSIPAQDHGTHLFEIYMTAEINGKTVESNHIVKDIIWYDENSDTPVIGTIYQTFTARQYEATNITYTVYDPSTETPNVSLKATYVNEDGETVEEYNSNITMSSNAATWQYKTNVIGEHTLTITCGETVKTLVATIVELGINVSPVTAGLAFDFNPVGYSNDDDNRLWYSGDIAMTVSDNFDWVNGGYQIDDNGDQCFCIKAGTSAEINYELFGDDAKSNGKQFKLIFKTENVANTDATFLSCVSDPTGTGKIGIEMKSQLATIYAKAESLPLPYAEEEVIEFEFNISSSSETPSMVMGYEDGVSTRPLVYDDTHDFQQQIGHREIISLGSADCDLYIYRFKVYNTSLSDRDILNNFIADARSAEEMIDRYDRNQIYKEGILDPDYLAVACPDLRIIKLEVPHFTADKDDKVYDASIQSIVECVYKNGDPIYDNWVAYDVVHSGQGTSSNNYGAAGRNLDIIIKPYKDYGNAPYIILGDGSRVNKVSLTRESIPTNYFNVKVNIASSENANNALFAKRYNQYNPYKRPFVREDESIIPYIKDTMEFQNCIIFVKESDPDLSTHVEFNDNEWHYYALGNIGDSKKTDSTRLTDPNDPYECIIEVMDNTLPNSNMPTGKVNEETGSPIFPIDPSEWTVGNSAYDSLYADLFDETGGIDPETGEYIKPNGLDDTYGMRYVYEDGTDEENEQYRQAVIDKWREFYEFVVTSTDKQFKENLGDYVVLDSVMYYYLFTLRYTMTDNHAKNSFWHYGKSNDLDENENPIRKWDLCFGYDFDTSLGIDNYGRMTYRYGYEEIDYVDGTSDWVWNCPQHVFFLRLRKLFDAELCELYTKLESLGAWSATGLINQFNEWQAQFPEEVWRIDTDRKYIRTYTKSFINGAAKPEFLKERANGRKKTQRAQFEKNQEKYMSSKFGGTVASSDDIVLRCSVPNTTLAVPANFDISLTPYSYVYLNVKYNTAPPVKVRAVPNTEYTIEYAADLADIIEIYSASCLKSIGDLSAAYLINGDFSNATKIRDLVLGSDVEGYNNTNSMTLVLGSNWLLNKLDIQNMSGLTSSLNLSGLKNLEELYAFGSNVSGVIFADGGNIEVAEIPSVGTIQMNNLNYLTDEGFEATSYDNLTKLVAENSLLDLVDLINNAPNLYQVRLAGIDWNLEDTTLLERLYGLAGVTNTGANSDQSVLIGKVYVPTIKESKLNAYNEVWSNLEIEAGQVTEQHEVTFVNDDGTVLEVQYVDNNMFAVDPVTREDNPIPVPTKESTVSTDYTYAGWDIDLSNTRIGSPRTVRATYTESVREYTVKYVVNMDNRVDVKQETKALYGSNVVYTGETPVYTKGETIDATSFYLFDGWDKSGLVDGDKVITAIFDDCPYGEGYFEGKELSDMRPVEVYALTRLVEMGVLSCDGESISGTNIQRGDDFSFEMGYDVDYDDIKSIEVISEKTVFNGTNYNDTGIKLFDEDKDFVLAIDYKMASSNSSGATLMQCFQTSGSNGFKLSYSSAPQFAWGTSNITPSNANEREMLVLRHIAGDNRLYVYTSNLGGSAIDVYTIDKSTITQSSIATLVLGAAKNDAGRFSNHGVGEIYWLKIWYMDLGEDICEKLVSWTHEKIGLEVSGFYRYALYDDYTKESTMSLLATNLLDRTKKYNNTNTNVGGWKHSLLNSYLNSRFYNAIPEQIKSLMKKVSVSSMIGGMSSEVSESGCYVNIPSAYDVDNTKTEYANEVYDTNGTIDFMISDERRKRSYLDGDYADYWLRTPDIRYSSYALHVDSNGDGSGVAGKVYSFKASNSEAGILIEISF